MKRLETDPRVSAFVRDIPNDLRRLLSSPSSQKRFTVFAPNNRAWADAKRNVAGRDVRFVSEWLLTLTSSNFVVASLVGHRQPYTPTYFRSTCLWAVDRWKYENHRTQSRRYHRRRWLHQGWKPFRGERMWRTHQIRGNWFDGWKRCCPCYGKGPWGPAL